MDISNVTKAARKVLKLKYCGAVIVAAGTASRMGGIDKVMAPLGGEPMIVRTVRRFQQCDVIREIVVVTRPDLMMSVMDLCHGFDKVKAVVVGGPNRESSVHMGLNTLSKKCKLVAVQDGARPLVSCQVIDRVVQAANAFGAAAPAVPVTDTVKVADAAGLITATPDRSTLFAVQTPQVFRASLLREAYCQPFNDLFTDDASVVESLGHKISLVEGERVNLKLTTPDDLEWAEWWLAKEGR